MMKKYALLMTVIAILTALAVLIGCPGKQLKSPADMSPQERAGFVLTMYNNADTNYRAQFAATPTPMSDDMKQYFTYYKAVLTNAAPAIDLYVQTVKSGGLPNAEQEQAIMTIIYKLQALLVKAIAN